ncbi:hypothetical protein ACLB2K_005698 [Fragaria x ananassa]
MEVAKHHVNERNETICPCKDCLNKRWQPLHVTRVHLLHRGMSIAYLKWTDHGEQGDTVTSEVDEQVDEPTGDLFGMIRDLFPSMNAGSQHAVRDEDDPMMDVDDDEAPLEEDGSEQESDEESDEEVDEISNLEVQVDDEESGYSLRREDVEPEIITLSMGGIEKTVANDIDYNGDDNFIDDDVLMEDKQSLATSDQHCAIELSQLDGESCHLDCDE